jgi:hypothetical protein
MLDPLLAAEVDLADHTRPDVVVFADAVGDERAIQLLRDPSIGCEVPEELFAGEPLGGGFVSGMGAVSTAIQLSPRLAS